MELNMKNVATSKGTWGHRFAIRVFTLILGVLIFWVLGFFVSDIRTIEGPKYEAIEEKHLDKDLLAKQEALTQQIADSNRRIENQTEKQRVVGDSSRNLQQTINQLIELQKLGLQNNVAFSETEQANFTSSLNLFLENQKKYQEHSQTIADMLERKQSLVRDKEQVEQEIEKQREPAREDYERLYQRHRVKLAMLQLAILLPFLLVAAIVIIKQRASIYFPLFLAFGGATLLKVGLVMHEYFPSKYFKYVLIGGLLIVVARVLIYFIRTIAFPKAQWLIEQYREAYERFLCPVCEYPIRIGPRRYQFWTRRTVNKIVVPQGGADAPEEAYSCPTCGHALFEECSACHNMRASMLPYCSHCGAEKSIQ